MSSQPLRQDMPLLDVSIGDVISVDTTVAWVAATGEPSPLDLIGHDGIDTFTGTLTGVVLDIGAINNGAGFQISLAVAADHRTYQVRTSRYNRSVARA